MKTDPRSLSVDDLKKGAFKDMFGVEWDDAPLYLNGDAQRMTGATGAELEPMWRKGPYLKLAPGTYIAKLEVR